MSPAAKHTEEFFSLAAGVAAALAPQQSTNADRGKKPHQGIFSENRPTRISGTSVKYSGTHQLSEWSRSETVLGPTNYLYSGSNVIAELDAGGNTLARYTHSLGVDQPLSQFRSGSPTYFEADGLGSVTSLTDNSGAAAVTYAYDVFGNLSGSTGNLTNPFRYTGREFDSETGLYFYRARYYDSKGGRFTSEDPLRFKLGPNFYAYVANDPVGHIDPSGLCPCGYHRVRLYYGPHFYIDGRDWGPDYHWYRQDSNGGWSSKHGWAPVGPQVNPDEDAVATGYSNFCARMCAPNQNGMDPQYAPMVESWNDPYHIFTNNCYSYACDRLHPPGPRGKPQPGGGLPEGFKCIEVINAAQRDGLTLDFDVPTADGGLQ